MIDEKKSIYAPFSAVKFLFRKPHTLRFPFEPKETADRYRGLHLNDFEACTGCGNCADICPNQAIKMVTVPEIQDEPGQTGERPRIDYGRCCFCGLCVDICPPGCLSLSRDYYHIDKTTDSFVYLAKDDTSDSHSFLKGNEYSILKASLSHRKADNQGFAPEVDYSLVEFERTPMEMLPPEERTASFVEIVRGFSEEQAHREASRCLECSLCEAACPAGMDIKEYILAIWRGDYERALRVIYQTNPLPSVCGRVCTHRCEKTCGLGKRGEPVAVRWLKRFAADQISPANYKSVLGTDRIEPLDEKVAVVGSGPAGLSAAHFLAVKGYQVVVFEALPQPGGVLRYGIPEYRLPYDALDKDIGYIRSLGVDIRCRTRVGRDIELLDLHRQFDAVFIATGLHVGRSTKVEGTDHEHVVQALPLLRDITEGREVFTSRRIVVIGGGDVAMDSARSMGRLQMQKYGRIDITLTCLESEDIMPATRSEIEETREEGIEIVPSRGPDWIEIREGKIRGLHTIECVSVFDEAGRFNPRFNREDKSFIEADMVIEAIGQGMDTSYIPPEVADQLAYKGRRIEVNERFQSSVPWLFVGGDIVQGPDVVTAIANGREAAEGIDAYLEGEQRRQRDSTAEAVR
jgi:glutamate synthase (NADPH/NADH) small chain